MIGTLIGRFLLVLIFYAIGLVIGWLWPLATNASSGSASGALSGVAGGRRRDASSTATSSTAASSAYGVSLSDRAASRSSARATHASRSSSYSDGVRDASSVRSKGERRARSDADWNTGTPNGHVDSSEGGRPRGTGIMGRAAGWRIERERHDAGVTGRDPGWTYGDAGSRAERVGERGGRVRPDGRRFGFAGRPVGTAAGGGVADGPGGSIVPDGDGMGAEAGVASFAGGPQIASSTGSTDAGSAGVGSAAPETTTAAFAGQDGFGGERGRSDASADRPGDPSATASPASTSPPDRAAGSEAVHDEGDGRGGDAKPQRESASGEWGGTRHGSSNGAPTGDDAASGTGVDDPSGRSARTGALPEVTSASEGEGRSEASHPAASATDPAELAAPSDADVAGREAGSDNSESDGAEALGANGPARGASSGSAATSAATSVGTEFGDRMEGEATGRSPDGPDRGGRASLDASDHASVDAGRASGDADGGFGRPSDLSDAAFAAQSGERAAALDVGGARDASTDVDRSSSAAPSSFADMGASDPSASTDRSAGATGEVRGSTGGDRTSSASASGISPDPADSGSSVTGSAAAYETGQGTAIGEGTSAGTSGGVSGGVPGGGAALAPGADPATIGDDLKRIRGVGPKNEERLKEAGVTHFAQIAAWTPEEARAVGEMLRFGGRIEREDWMSQARELAEGRETEFSRRVDAGRVRTSLDRDDPRYSEEG